MDTNETIQSGLLGIDSESLTTQEMKIKFPEFPLWWLNKAKRNMEGLREIALHLHSKTENLRTSRGFRGDANRTQIVLDEHRSIFGGGLNWFPHF